PPSSGAFRYYPVGLVQRIRFIKQAQELGFSLEEIGELLLLEDGADRGSIQRIAASRLSQIEAKLGDLKRMQRVLKGLLTECEHTKASLPCPIIGTIRMPSTSQAASRDTSKQVAPTA
ncbi:MAG: MerR family DNA-binding protein, partial [Pseudomonadota bacterium]|nr:MerR family DNA-binding protein [Pseudomonadota bacterium]